MQYQIDIPKGCAFFSEIHCGKPTNVDSRLLVSNLEEVVLQNFSQEQVEEGLIVKPGTGSAGIGVQFCCGMSEILDHARAVLVNSHYGLVQEFVRGHEYRVAILNDMPLVVYRKRNPVIRGDGRSSLHALICGFLAGISKASESNLDEARVMRLAGLRHLHRGHVIPEDQEIELELEVRNLSKGAWPEVMDDPPAPVLETALEAHSALGLTYSGVDLKVREGNERVCILEVNGNPGFSFLQRFRPKIADSIHRRIAANIVELL